LIVEDIQDREELVLISDSQDVEAIVKYLLPSAKVEDALSEIGCIFAEVVDGDYGDVLFSPYSTAWLTAPLYDLRTYFS